MKSRTIHILVLLIVAGLHCDDRIRLVERTFGITFPDSYVSIMDSSGSDGEDDWMDVLFTFHADHYEQVKTALLPAE